VRIWTEICIKLCSFFPALNKTTFLLSRCRPLRQPCSTYEPALDKRRWPRDCLRSTGERPQGLRQLIRTKYKDHKNWNIVNIRSTGTKIHCLWWSVAVDEKRSQPYYLRCSCADRQVVFTQFHFCFFANVVMKVALNQHDFCIFSVILGFNWHGYTGWLKIYCQYYSISC